MTLKTNVCTFSISEYFTLCKHMTLHTYYEMCLRFGYMDLTPVTGSAGFANFTENFLKLSFVQKI